MTNVRVPCDAADASVTEERSGTDYPRPNQHQLEALHVARHHFDTGGSRASISMPMGSGKTLVGAWLLDALGANGVGVVVLPSLELVDQTWREYETSLPTIASGVARRLVVASDSSEDRQRTTGTAAIRAFIMEDEDRRILFSTYDSLDRVGDALRSANCRASLVVFDEAHLMASRTDKYGLGFDDARLNASRRVFLTGTRKKSMDDEAAFGPLVYSLTQQQAEEAGRILPIRLLVYNESASYERRIVCNPNLEVVTGDKRLPGADVELAVAILDAFDRFGLSKAFSFHKTNKAAKTFSEVLQATVDDSDQVVGDGEQMAIGQVASTLPAAKRDARMQAFREANKAVLINCRLLSTGVNIPAVDLCVIASRRWSHVDILQMIGRAARVSPGKECGYVLLPTRMDALAAGDYSTVYETLRAFLEQDDEKQRKLDAAAFEAGRRGTRHIDLDGVFGPAFVEPVDINVTAMQREFGAVLFRLAGSFSSFEMWLGRLQAYREEHGDCLVPQSYETADGFKLGLWVNTQRQAAKGQGRSKLSEAQRDRLDLIGFVWEPNEAQWEAGFAALCAYRKEHGDCLVPTSYETADGYKLGVWVHTQRRAAKGQGKWKLSDAQRARLDAIGFVWDKHEAAWEAGFGALRAYREQHGDCLVPKSYVTADGYKLGVWVRSQRQAAKGQGKCKLSEAQRTRLDAIGFAFDGVKAQKTRAVYERRDPEANQVKHATLPSTTDNTTIEALKTTVADLEREAQALKDEVVLLTENNNGSTIEMLLRRVRDLERKNEYLERRIQSLEDDKAKVDIMWKRQNELADGTDSIRDELERIKSIPDQPVRKWQVRMTTSAALNAIPSTRFPWSPLKRMEAALVEAVKTMTRAEAKDSVKQLLSYPNSETIVYQSLEPEPRIHAEKICTRISEAEELSGFKTSIWEIQA